MLLVDADLRKPRLHEVFGVSNRVGLVNFLTGSAEEGALVVPTQVPNLYVTPAGPIPPNSSELLSSERMLEFVALASSSSTTSSSTPRRRCRSPTRPCWGRWPTVWCSASAPGMVLREDARSVMQRLQLSNIRVLGVALNFFREEPGRYGKRYRSYESYIEKTAGETDAKA